MKPKILKLSLLALLVAMAAAGCKKDELPDETRKAEDYIGKYSGYVTRDRMAQNGWILSGDAFVEKIPTEVEITQSDEGDNFLMVYISAYHDSILCEFDESLGYVWIRDEPYSFYMRTRDFPEFSGNYDEAVSTYGNMGSWQHTDTIFFSIDFLKDINDSIFQCQVSSKKINKL